MLQTVRLLEIIRILHIDNLEQDLLYICLICLILNNLTELDAINFCRHEPFHLVKQALLLTKYGLKRRCYL